MYNRTTPVDMYKASMLAFEKLIEAKKETLRMLAAKYEGQVSEETQEVEQEINDLRSRMASYK